MHIIYLQYTKGCLRLLPCRKALQVFRGANVKGMADSQTKEPDGKSLYRHIACRIGRNTGVKRA